MEPMHTFKIMDLDEIFGPKKKELNIAYAMKIIGNNNEYHYNDTASTFIQSSDIHHDDNIWMEHELYGKIESTLILDLNIKTFAITK